MFVEKVRYRQKVHTHIQHTCAWPLHWGMTGQASSAAAVEIAQVRRQSQSMFAPDFYTRLFQGQQARSISEDTVIILSLECHNT